MTISGRLSARAGLVIGLALGGAALMVRVNNGGTLWLKFLLYAASIVGAYLLTVLSPVRSCGWPLFRRQPKN